LADASNAKPVYAYSPAVNDSYPCGSASSELFNFKLNSSRAIMANISIDAIADLPPQSEQPEDWRRFFGFSTDHKVIGIQYIVTSFIFFLIGGVLAMVIRGELITPESDLVDRAVYNSMFTMHGTIMLFLWTFPVLLGISNYLVPLMIGARDMAFPRLNAVAFWMVPVFGIILMASFFIPGGSSQSGWWAYPPVSLQNPTGNLINGQFLWLLAVAISGVASIMGAINFVTTIFRMRTTGMTWFKMPVFVWTVLAAQIIQLFGLPALTAGAVMLLSDLTFGTSFFDPAKGGDPVLFQHFFWFYSHPAVYVIILPVFGIFSEIFPVYARKPLFGYKVVAVSSLIITGLSALGALVMFVFAGITGIMLASVPVDIHVNNTYFVVGHFHYVIYGAVVMGIYAGLYHWFPKMTGKMYSEGLGKLHFILTFIGTNTCFFPMHPLGLQGMPRRVASYDPEFAFWNVIASLGGFLLGVSTIPFILNMVSSWVQGEKAPKNPWRAIGLEWLVSSPPSHENFDELPIVIAEPYGYGKDEPLVSNPDNLERVHATN